MNSREQYKANSDQISQLRTQEKELQEKIWNLLVEQEQLAIQIVREDNLFAKCDWDLKVKRGLKSIDMHLECHIDDLYQEIVDLLRSNYHCRFEILPGCFLYFDDNSITLTFADINQAIDFIRDNKLELPLGNLESDVQHAFKMAQGLNDILSMIKCGPNE